MLLNQVLFSYFFFLQILNDVGGVPINNLQIDIKLWPYFSVISE